MNKFLSIIFFLLIIISSCTKNDDISNTGSIKVKLYYNNIPLPSNDINMSYTQEDIDNNIYFVNELTNYKGEVIFENIKAGTYKLWCKISIQNIGNLSHIEDITLIDGEVKSVSIYID